MKKFLSLLSAVLLGASVFAQVVYVPYIHLKVDDADENSISITGMDIEAKITANIAITTYDIVFYNNSSRNLEGEFEFPLKEGQSVCGFALDINGKMREGVIVEKDKGRQVFEDVVRKQADPGLLEVTSGNNFKARIYPIPKKGSRHVRIKIQESLTEAKYILDPLTDKEIRRFSFKLLDYRNAVEADIISSDVIDLSTGIAATFEKSNYLWTKPIEVKLAKKSNNPEVFIETLGADTFFYAPVPVDVKTEPKAKVGVLGVYFDTSLSRRNCNLEKELNLLKAYITKQGSGSVEIVSFSNEVKAKKVFKFSQWPEIEEYIKNLTYDGATNLHNLSFKPSKKYEEVLIFSDGLVNWTATENETVFTCPVNTICSTTGGNYSELKKIARNNNGIFINLAVTKTNEAVNQLLVQPLRLLKVIKDNGIFQFYPAEGTVIQNDFAITGILKLKNSSVKLQFGYGDKPVFEKTVEVSAVSGFEAQNVGRLWAQKKIDELSLDYKKNKNQILELSREYTIVTEGTSLIVLESVRDYARYKITPPEELLKEYNQMTGAAQKSPNTDKIPDRVYEGFKAYREWWKTTPEQFRKQAKEKEEKLYETSASSRASEAVMDFEFAEEDSVTLNNVQREAPVYNDISADRVAAAAAKNSSEIDTEEPVSNAPANAEIKIQAWNPKSDYIKILKKTDTSKMYEVYLELRNTYASSPSFYMDVASYFYKEDLQKEAVRIISNLSELNLENTDVLRALGNKLTDFGCYELALQIFENLINLRPEVPQFLRDAAMVCEKLGEYQKACDLLYKVASRSWDYRYEDIQQICLNDMNAIIGCHKVNTSGYDRKLVENFPVDVRIVLTWNTDNCDIDLWVTDPNGEKCYYAHNRTLLGGRLSRDFIEGYGPEEFCLRVAKKGDYKIQAHYYGAHQQKVLQPVTVQAEVFTNFGRENQECEILTLQLKNVDGDYTVGEVTFRD